MKNKIIIVCIFFFVFIFNLNVFSNVDSQRVKDINSNINSIYSMDEFNFLSEKDSFIAEYINEKINSIKEIIKDFLKKNRVNDYEMKKVNIDDENVLAIKIIAIVFILALIIFIAIKIFFSIRKNAKNKKQEIEDDIESVIFKMKDFEEIEKQSKEMYENGNYKIALRLLYISMLLYLNKKNIIKINKSKTNRQYLYELKDSNYIYYENVDKFTDAFNYFWYGNNNIDKNGFDIYYNEYKIIRGGSWKY